MALFLDYGVTRASLAGALLAWGCSAPADEGTGSGGSTFGQNPAGSGGLSVSPTDPVEPSSEQEPMEDCDSTLELIVRDFNSDHPDMESPNPGQSEVGCGMVESQLFVGSNGVRTPVFQASNGTGKRTSISDDGIVTCTPYGVSNPEPTNLMEITSAATFEDWYQNVPGTNQQFTVVLPLEESTEAGTYFYDSGEDGFFPADGQGFNEVTQNAGQEHNFHFTTEAHVRFGYFGGEKFTFSGDDDMWIFVNGRLALDLGGLHGPLRATIDFDALAEELGIEPNNTYNMDIFHAERHTSDSNYRVETNIECFQKVEVPLVR